MFFFKSINNPTQRFNVLNYVDFSTGSTTISAGSKLYHKTASIIIIYNNHDHELLVILIVYLNYETAYQ